jgi:two-component system, NarL family, sensor histidine kinase UhpB
LGALKKISTISSGIGKKKMTDHSHTTLVKKKNIQLLKVLLVDDDEDDFILIRKLLKNRSYHWDSDTVVTFSLEWTPSYEEALKAFQKNDHDAYLIDYYLEERTGMELLEKAEEAKLSAPIIILTGKENYHIDAAAAKAGAADYLVKIHINEPLLERSLRYAIERKQAEENLRRAHEEKTILTSELQDERNRLLKVIKHAPSAFLVTDKDGLIIIANENAEALFGELVAIRNLENLTALPFGLLEGDSYSLEELPILRSLVHGETHINVELVFTKPNGQKHNLLLNSSPILDQFGNINGTVVIFQDITRRKQEEEAARMHTTRIRVQQHLIEYQEMERLRIAQDLHDGPLQELIGIHLALDDIHYQGKRLVEGKKDHQIEEVLEELKGLKTALKHQINELRSFSSELRPPFLVAFGLERAIRSHIKKFQEKDSTRQVVMELEQDMQRLPELTTLALFRIFQELLNNIHKHAEASHILIRLTFINEKVCLYVKDNGKGFKVPQQWIPLARKGHLGLVGVQERARSVGGEVHLTSKPGSGTEIEVWAPLFNVNDGENQEVFSNFASSKANEGLRADKGEE